MQTLWFPERACNEVDKITRSFIWGNKSFGRSLNLVRWVVMQQSQSKGGLGVRRAHNSNVALWANSFGASWRVKTNFERKF